MNGGLALVQREIAAFGPLAPVASIVLMVLHSLIPFFPSEQVTVANGLLFGAVVGTGLSWIGAMMGAAAGYAIGGYGGRPLLRRVVSTAHISVFEDLVRRHGIVGLLVLRLIPVVSFNLINYASGFRWKQSGRSRRSRMSAAGPGISQPSTSRVRRAGYQCPPTRIP